LSKILEFRKGNQEKKRVSPEIQRVSSSIEAGSRVFRKSILMLEKETTRMIRKKRKYLRKKSKRSENLEKKNELDACVTTRARGETTLGPQTGQRATTELFHRWNNAEKRGIRARGNPKHRLEKDAKSPARRGKKFHTICFPSTKKQAERLKTPKPRNKLNEIENSGHGHPEAGISG